MLQLLAQLKVPNNIAKRHHHRRYTDMYNVYDIYTYMFLIYIYVYKLTA